MRQTKLKLKPIQVTAGGLTYKSYRVSGTVNGRRIRYQSTNRNEAFAELTRLQIEAANCSTVQARPTRLTAEQVAEAETAFRRLGPDKSLSGAVEWYLTNYKPPCVAMTIPEAAEPFIVAKVGHVSPLVIRDYRRILRGLAAAYIASTLPISPKTLHFGASRKFSEYASLRGETGFSSDRPKPVAVFESLSLRHFSFKS